MNQTYAKLEKILEKMQALQSALILFEWDNDMSAAKGSLETASAKMAVLSGMYYDLSTSDELKQAVEELSRAEDLTEVQAAVVANLKKEEEKLKAVSAEEYMEFKALGSRSMNAWHEAKEKADYELFKPYLEKMIAYKKKVANNRKKDGQTPYDVLLGDFEEGFSIADMDDFFGKMKAEIVPLLKQIPAEESIKNREFLFRNYPLDKQKEWNEWLADYVGYDFSRGIIGETEHPYCTSIHPDDVRIATHYYTDNLESAIFSTVHECGHAIYEQNNNAEVAATPLFGGASSGMHESQSRFYENVLGRSKAFWKPLYPKFAEVFKKELEGISLDDFIRAVNSPQASLIRTESDELTYCLHIMVRYEMEKKIINGECSMDELPKMWNALYEEYLGVTPENDRVGILQDVHWSMGEFGYFPSYALGNAFAAQIYHQMKKDLNVEELLENGELAVIKEYLGKHIHQYGESRAPKRLLKDMTGEEFNPDYYIEYLKEKFQR